jgi:ankyrin repeat protein
MEWDNIHGTLDARRMLPWVQPDTSRLLPCDKIEFEKLLASVGDHSYLGKLDTFQLIHVFALLRKTLSLLILLDRGGDLNATTDTNANCLHCAAAGGDERLVEILISKGFQSDDRVDGPGGRKMSPLMLGARMGHVGVLSVLVEKGGADVNAKDKEGNTALIYASARGYVDAVQYLLDQGAKTQAETSNGSTALQLAAGAGHVSILSLLLRYGADVNAVDKRGYSSLFCAAAKGRKEAVEELLAQGANCYLRAGDGWSPIGAAVKDKRIELVELMVKKCGLVTSTQVEPNGRSVVKFARDENLTGVQGILRGGEHRTPRTSTEGSTIRSEGQPRRWSSRLRVT